MSNVKITWHGNAAKQAMRKGRDRGLTLAGEHVLEESRRIVPIEEGTLERSGRVSGPDGGTVAVSYDTPYAVRQHEDLTLRHDRGRQSKYLETPLNSERGVVGRIVSREVKRELDGGFGGLL